MSNLAIYLLGVVVGLSVGGILALVIYASRDW